MKYIALLLALSFALVACQPAPVEKVATPESIASPDPANIPTAVPTIDPTDTPEPTVTPEPTPLSVADMFEQLSPSVARVMVGQRFGSGVLLDDGYVLTNAHIVWPDSPAQIIFPDGSEFKDVPVVGVDLQSDLALLGPIETELTPVIFEDGEELRVGSEVLLIGYPGDASRAPRPTLTETLISRKREQAQMGLTLFQVDSPVAGGQSGGIALTPDGRVIGLTGNRITEAGFGLITSGADILPRIQQLIDDTSQVGNGSGRGPQLSKAKDRHFFQLPNEEEPKIFMVDIDTGNDLEVSADSKNDAWFMIAGSSRIDFALINELSHGKESTSIETLEPGIHFVVVGQNTTFPGNVTLESNMVLTPYVDSDDGERLQQEDVYEGVIDFPGDVDEFVFTLAADEEINITVSSLMIDPQIMIRPIATGEESIVFDDNSGDGIIGTEAEVTFKAPHSGVYELFVSDAQETGQAGGYVVTLQEPYEGAPTPVSPKPTPTPVTTDYGDMKLYESSLFSYTLQYPKRYKPQAPSNLCPETYSGCFADVNDLKFNFLAIVEGESGLPGAPQTLEEYAERVRTAPVETNLEYVGREDVVTAQGEPAIVMSFATADGIYHMKWFGTFWQNKAIVTILYFYQGTETEPLVDYVFSTFGQ